jgi:hypothetical protein
MWITPVRCSIFFAFSRNRRCPLQDSAGKLCLPRSERSIGQSNSAAKMEGKIHELI